jgi:hypothetical protein
MTRPDVVKVATGTALGADADNGDTQGSDAVLFLRLSRGLE